MRITISDNDGAVLACMDIGPQDAAYLGARLLESMPVPEPGSSLANDDASASADGIIDSLVEACQGEISNAQELGICAHCDHSGAPLRDSGVFLHMDCKLAYKRGDKPFKSGFAGYPAPEDNFPQED